MTPIQQLVARVLLAHLFVLSGFTKLLDYVSTQAHMESAGVPGFLLPFVILLEASGGLALLVGWKTP